MEKVKNFFKGVFGAIGKVFKFILKAILFLLKTVLYVFLSIFSIFRKVIEFIDEKIVLRLREKTKPI